MIAIFVVVFASCASQAGGGKWDPNASSSGLTFEVTRAFKPGSISRVVVFPAMGAEGAGILPGVTGRVTHQLIHQLSNVSAYSIANLDRAGWEKTAADVSRSPEPLVKNALKFAANYDAQAVIYSEVYRYVESDGSSIGANAPASVGIRVWMVNSTTGQMLWRGIFDDSERPLSDNLFELKDKMQSGFKYRSADQILESGMKRVAQVLEQFRVAPKT